MTDGRERRTGLAIGWLQLFVVILLVERALVVFGMGPLYEEAYYWLWGQHPDLSYFDHPPLNAWLLGLSSLPFGWTIFALRLPTWLSLGATIWLLMLWSKRLGGEGWRHWFWTTLVIFLASPMFSVFTAIAFPDHLLVPLGLAFSYWFTRFMDGYESGRPNYRLLWLAAAALGLAMLAKYNAVLLGLAAPLYALGTARRRALFRQWQPFAAAFLALAIFSPVLIWNAGHGFMSFQFHLVERRGGGELSFSPSRLKASAVILLLLVSPFLFDAIVRFVASGAGRWKADTALGFARAAFVLSTAAFASVSLVMSVFPHWNIMALIAVLPFLAGYLRAGWLVIAHAIFGIAVLGLAVANFTVAPIGFPPEASRTAAYSYGWSEIAAAMAAAEAAHDADFVAGPDTQLTPRLAFAMARRDIVPMRGVPNQYRFWFDPADYAGKTAIVLGDPDRSIHPEIAARFASIRQVGEIEVRRFGTLVSTFPIWLGERFLR